MRWYACPSEQLSSSFSRHNDNDDADEDGVPDACDICPIGDDGIDGDADGTPDACDCDGVGATCHSNGYCVPTDDGFECECLEGYQGDGVTTCENTDECAADPSPCVADATCTDNDGGFTCECSGGHYGAPYTGGACEPCSICPDGTYESAECVGTTDTQCTPCHPDCTETADRVCDSCTVCDPDEYMVSDCSQEAVQGLPRTQTEVEAVAEVLPTSAGEETS